MSILLPVIRRFAGWLVDGEKTIEWRTKPLPVGTAYIFETKKNGGCAKVIGKVTVWASYKVEVDEISDEWLKYGKVDREFLKRYARGKPLYANLVVKAKRYDKPLLVENYRYVKKIRGYHRQDENFAERLLHGGRVEVRYITRPPQSWCYCEDLKGGDKE